MDTLKKGTSFYCGALLWFVNSIICFKSHAPVFKYGNNILWAYVSLLASIIFFINGYKKNR